MLSGLLIKRKDVESVSGTPASLQTDKAELESRLQRLAKQLKKEQDLFADDLQRTRSELLQELSVIRKRIDQAESSSHVTQSHSDTGVSHTDPVALQKDEAAEVDMLALQERYRRVFELSKAGLSPDEIAKRLGAGRGEIDLIFSLASKRERGHVNG